jgi:hypothetical protein
MSPPNEFTHKRTISTASGEQADWWISTEGFNRGTIHVIGSASTAVVTVYRAWSDSDTGLAFSPTVDVVCDSSEADKQIDCTQSPFLRFSVTTNQASKTVEVVVYLTDAPDPFPDPANHGLEVARGTIPGVAVVHKFGRNTSVPTTYTPVTFGGVFNELQVGAATTLRVKAGNTNDTAAGTGAREVTLTMIDETGAEVTEALATAGTSASSATTTTAIRLIRVRVTKSGTYATSAAGSHAAAITIENGAGGTDWATIDATGFPRGSSEIGVTSIPTGKTAYLENLKAFTDSTKTTTILLFQRTGILQTAAPYDAMTTIAEERLEGGSGAIVFDPPIKVIGPADLGCLAKVSSTTAEVDVDFEYYLVDD